MLRTHRTFIATLAVLSVVMVAVIAYAQAAGATADACEYQYRKTDPQGVPYVQDGQTFETWGPDRGEWYPHEVHPYYRWTRTGQTRGCTPETTTTTTIEEPTTTTTAPPETTTTTVEVPPTTAPPTTSVPDPEPTPTGETLPKTGRGTQTVAVGVGLLFAGTVLLVTRRRVMA